ncbi:MAG: nicotinate phosphoribosyltransferase [Bryobacteraceae bacterium]
MNALPTDLYELTVSAVFFETGKFLERASFELSIRRLPRNRAFVLAAGLPQAVDYLLNLKFEAAEIDYLRALPHFANTSAAFFDYLRDFKFTGDLFAVPEGTPLFAGEPLLTVRAPLIEAQIPETYLLSAITFPTLIATKAARMAEASAGRDVAEFGTRRAHTPDAGVLGARAAYIGGCSGTSNALAGYRYGIPVVGTAAHSWVMAFASETEAFRNLQKLLGTNTVHLIDTNDTVEGARKAIALGKPLWGVRLDSGDLLALSFQVRAMLDEAGLRDAKIMASGDLDEYKIRDLLDAGAPLDSFGVGTELATSGDAPSMGTVYKMVEIERDGTRRYTAKRSEGKHTIPGEKQIFRFADHDVLGCAGESMDGGEKLLRPVILGGKLVEPLPDAHGARERAARSLAKLRRPESFRVEHSASLEALIQSL